MNCRKMQNRIQPGILDWLMPPSASTRKFLIADNCNLLCTRQQAKKIAVIIACKQWIWLKATGKQSDLVEIAV